jgi:hypothetical protein
VGFDIVYLYGAHGYLLSGFFSTYFNQRTDAYGGSLENRGRFWLETLEAVRDAVGADCAIATRIPVNGREGPPGIETDDMLELIRMASPLVDLFDVNVGVWPGDSVTSRYYPEGHERPWTDRVREATEKPVVGGRPPGDIARHCVAVVDESLEGDMLRQHLHAQGNTAHRDVVVTTVDESGVRGTDEFDRPWSLNCTGVVLVTQQRSDDELY